MNDPQIWTLIGVFAAVMLGGLTLVVTLLRATIDAKFETLDARFETLDARFLAIDAKFDSLESKMSTRFDHLDRDVQAIAAHVWGTDRG